MKEFSVWSEGYCCTGQTGTAQYVGKGIGNTFQEACKDALLKKKWDMSYYDEKRNTYWGCAFYDNEIDARKNFG